MLISRGLLVLLITMWCGIVYSQISRCGTDAAIAAHNDYALRLQKDWEELVEERSVQSDSIIIPLHIIIVHPPGQAIGSGANLSTARVLSQIEATNLDFRRRNSNREDTPMEFAVGDSRISFQLASIDPNGEPTDGITRYAIDDDFDTNELEIKDNTKWPRDTYINIWVAPTLDDLGFASIPSPQNLPPIRLDGAAVLTSAFGGPGFATFFPYNLGRTLTHELGHYLGLRHIWDRDGCNSDDGIADTPRQDTSHFGCPVHPRPSCGNNGDMFMNYMDYTHDACMNAFTIGQINYMWSVLNGSRNSLLTAGDRAFDQTEPLAINIVDRKNPSCADGFDGEISVSASGGVGNYRYRINAGPWRGNPVFRFLVADTYLVEVIDNDDNAVTSLPVTLEDPPPITWHRLSITDLTCYGDQTGSIEITVNGAQGLPMLTADQGVVSDNIRVDSLGAGLVQLTVLDSAGCTIDTVVEVQEPPLLVPEITPVDISCYGLADGAAMIEASGGLSPYDYSVNGTAYGSNNAFFGYGAGRYSIFVRDSSGCIATDSFDVTEPDSLVLDIRTSEGQLIVTPTGGRAPYRYQLNDGPIVQDSIFEGLVPGDYTVTVYDDNMCTADLMIVFTANQSIDLSAKALIWPIPASSGLHLAREVSSFSLYNLNGSIAVSLVDRHYIDVSHLPAGTYMAHLESDEHTYWRKVLILR